MNRFFCAVSLLTVAVLPPVVAQNQPYIPPADNGTQLFRGLFDFHSITPESASNLRKGYDYRNLIVVVFGNPGDFSSVPEYARNALKQGGAVLIATEKPLSLSQFLPSMGNVEISGTRVMFPRDPSGVLQQVSYGFVVPVQPVPGEDRVFNRPEMELFTAFNRIEVNTASHVSNQALPPELARTVAIYPEGSRVNMPVERQPAKRQHAFAAAGVGTNRANPFRCVAVADTDLFTNRLIYGSAHPTNPNENLKFANHLVQWLKGPEGRTKCLFVVDGTVIDKFDDVKYSAIPLDPQIPDDGLPPLPDPIAEIQKADNEGKIADMGNQKVAEIQEDDLLNRPWTSSRERRAGFYLGCLVVAAVFLYLMLRFRSLGQRFLALFRPIPKDPHRLGPDTAVGSLEHRRLELLRGGNYSGPVRSYVRELFEERGLPRGYDRDRLPPVEFDVRNPDFLRKSVRTLWAEVCSTKAVTYGRWKELEPMLAAVRAAADDDRWWFTPDEGAA